MKIFVRVKTNARRNLVEKIDENHFKVSVVAMPLENKANLAVAEALADYFKIPKSKIVLVSGNKSKDKIFEIY